MDDERAALTPQERKTMAETNDRPWWHAANREIIGLAPEPFGDEWPTHGYDGELRSYDWDATGAFARTGVTREQWLELTDEMIRRWTAFRAHLLALPDDAAPSSGAEA